MLTATGREQLLEKLRVSALLRPRAERCLLDLGTILRYHLEYVSFIILRPPKVWSRCETKVAEYMTTKGMAEVDAIGALPDLIGGRVVVMFTTDRLVAHGLLCNFLTENRRRRVELHGEPPEEWSKPSGYTALHQTLRVTGPRAGSCLFEVQFMDVFEHAWDQLQVPLYRFPLAFDEGLHERLRLLKVDLTRVAAEFDAVRQAIKDSGRRRS